MGEFSCINRLIDIGGAMSLSKENDNKGKQVGHRRWIYLYKETNVLAYGADTNLEK